MLLTPSFFLGSSFLVLVVAIHQAAAPERKVWSAAAVAFATLAARVFPGDGLARVVRRFLTANGLLIPFLLFQMYFHPLIWIAALWAVTFPGATWALARWFRRAE